MKYQTLYNACRPLGWPYNMVAFFFHEDPTFSLLGGHAESHQIRWDPHDRRWVPEDLAESVEYILNNRMHPRIAQVLRMRFKEGMTLQEVGESLGVTRQRVHGLIHTQARMALIRNKHYICIGLHAVEARAEQAFRHGNKGALHGRE